MSGAGGSGFAIASRDDSKGRAQGSPAPAGECSTVWGRVLILDLWQMAKLQADCQPASRR